MKKMVLILMVLALAVPSMAATVTVTGSASGLNGTIGWSGNGSTAATRARAFALVLQASAGTFTACTASKTGQSASGSLGYGIFPGQIIIDGNNGNVQSYGSPVEQTKYPGASGSGIGTNKLVVALGSLYGKKTGDGDVNAPGASGNLFSYTVSGNCSVTVTVESTYRGGVVAEDANAMTVTLPSPIVHSAGCKGDFNSSNTVTSTDISLLVGYWNANKNAVTKIAPLNGPGWVAGMDINASGTVTSTDISLLVAHWNATKNAVTKIAPCMP